MVYWHSFRMHFPKDAVLMRTLSLAGRRLETQLLHYDGVDWRAYTFAWRDDQSDADLVPAEGAEKEVRDGEQKRVWQFHSRSQCMSCHSNQSEYALAFLPEQLNRPGPDGRNQLVALTEAGFIRRAGKRRQVRCRRSTPPRPRGNEGSPTRPTQASRWRRGPVPTSTPIAVTAIPTTAAGRSLCGCSSPSPVAEMKAVGVRPTRGDFALPDASIIKPGDPYASTLYFRMAKFGRDRMPHIGSERPDEAGLDLDRAMDRRDGPGRGKDGPGPGQRAAWPVADQPEVRAAAGAEARPRRAGRRRARRVAGRGGEAPERPDPRPVRGLSAIGRAEGAEARLEPPAQGHPGSQGRPRPGGEAVLVAAESSAAVATGSATGARRSGRTYRPSESFVRARTCWTASWSRRAGSSRSTPPMSPRRQTAFRSPVCWSSGTKSRWCCGMARARRSSSRPRTWRNSGRRGLR